MPIRVVLVAAALVIAGCGSPAAEQQASEPPPIAFDGALATEASAKIAHGNRLMSVLGCRGCHTASLQGQQFYELYASNLTRDVPNYSDAELERLVRSGVHPAGRDMWGMPSEIFQHLSNSDLQAVTAYLRTLAPAGPSTGKPLPFGPEIQKLIDEGRLMPAAQSVQKTKNDSPVDLGARHALGRYITMVTCAECHGPELKGNEGDTPDLITAGAYSREEFEKLMTTGTAPGGRELKDLMVNVAQGRFSKLTQHERDALYAYLKARAEQPQ